MANEDGWDGRERCVVCVREEVGEGVEVRDVDNGFADSDVNISSPSQPITLRSH